MYNTSFIKKLLLAATVVLLYSCDKDFNAIGDDLIGDDHFGLESEKYDVIAYNQEITPIQSNALSSNALGIYENPVFGTTTANYATQVTLSTYAPTIGEVTKVKSVILSVPYFSHTTAADSKGGYIYELDSIYGDPKGKIKLSIYESGYQMRSSYFSGGGQIAQLYYTDENAAFKANIVGPVLNDSIDKRQNEEFAFDATQRKDSTLAEGSTTKYNYTYTAPEMRVGLNKTVFLNKILKAPASKLSSQDVFQEYFRGLYFQVEKSGSNPSNMALLDFSKAKITINYTAKTEITTDDPNLTEDKSLSIIFKGTLPADVSTAGFLQDVKNVTYDNAVKAFNKTAGDERLYVKGGQGSLAVINLSDFASKLETIRANKWMVNEANLVFYVDADKMTGTVDEPNRVYLYDLTHNVPLVDYYSDGTTSLTSNTAANDAKYVFGGLIKRGDNKRGVSYKIRLTDHIRNLIKDATLENVKLGLVVSQSVNINASNFLKLKNDEISEAPRTSVMNPLGTILYGGTASVPVDKRLRLEVYYTKPN